MWKCKDTLMDMIPADALVNTIIAVGWHTCIKKPAASDQLVLILKYISVNRKLVNIYISVTENLDSFSFINSYVLLIFKNHDLTIACALLEILLIVDISSKLFYLEVSLIK